MEQIPDAPWIRDAELNGMDSPPEVRCPICGEDCGTLYIDRAGDVAGCENCVSGVDAAEWMEQYGEE